MIRQVASEAVTALRASPLALALVLINIVFVCAGIYVLRDISRSVERKDTLLAQIINDYCSVKEKAP